MLEPKLVATLESVLPGKVFSDVAKSGTTAPWCTYQQIGGKSPTSLDQQLIDKRNGIFQISVWAKTRQEATINALSIESALSLSTLQVTPQGSLRATYEPETGLYGAMQDFSIWGNRL